MSIRRKARQAIRSDSRVVAKVESLHLGLATVRMGKNGTGARLSNLPYTGVIAVDDMVFVDHSVNAITVRPFQYIPPEAEVVVPEAPHQNAVASYNFGEDVLAAGHVTLSKDTKAKLNTGESIPFDTVVYDTMNEWDSTEKEVVPYSPGVYFVSMCFTWRWTGVHDFASVWRCNANIGTSTYEYYSRGFHHLFLLQDRVTLLIETLFRFNLDNLDVIIPRAYIYGPSEAFYHVDTENNIPWLKWVRLAPQADVMTGYAGWWERQYYNDPYY